MKFPTDDEPATLHALFPTLVYQSQLEEHNRFDEAFAAALPEFGFEPKTRGRTRHNAGEYHGRVLLHQVEALQPFFAELADQVACYLRALGMQPEQFTVQCLKTWFVLCDPDEPSSDTAMVAHNHSCSEISWVYYTDVPDDCPAIQFHAGPRRSNAPFESAFHYDWHDSQKSAVNKLNWWNSDTWSIHPRQGDILLFPGHQLHSVDANLTTQRRISVAGDIALTLHPELLDREYGRTAPEHWLSLPMEKAD